MRSSSVEKNIGSPVSVMQARKANDPRCKVAVDNPSAGDIIKIDNLIKMD